MSDLIRRDSIITELKLDSQLSRISNTYAWMYIDMAIDRIKKTPAVDAVEVVKCKYCKHFTKDMAIGICKRDPKKPIFPMEWDNFCKYGERREDVK